MTYVETDISFGGGAKPPKRIIWLKGRIRSPPFSEEARRQAGMKLRMLQRELSLSMPVSRPMPSIAKSCHELRIRDVDHDWRIIYRIDPGSILVLDVFSKQTSNTPWSVIEGCRRRLIRFDSGQHRTED